MKAYESASAVAARNRVKKVHAKARFVGILYTLGALALVVFSIMPMLEGYDSLEVFYSFGAGTFFSSLFGSGLLGTVFGILYIILLLTTVINLVRCIAKLGWLSDRSSRYVNGYNKNMRAMEQMGERFSSSFARLVNFYLLVYIVYAPRMIVVSGDGTINGNLSLTFMGYIALAVSLVIHFIAGLVSGKVSRFNVQGVGGVVQELKRECGLFAYFFRNLVQVIAMAAIIYLYTGVGNNVFGETVYNLLSREEPDIGLPVIVQGVLYLTMVLCVRHATSDTEFNRLGSVGKGMKVFMILSLFLTVLGAVAAVVDAMNMTYFYIAGIGLVCFFVHAFVKSKCRAPEDAMMMSPFMPFNPMPPMSKREIRKMEKQQPEQPLPPMVGEPMPPMQDPIAQRPIIIYQQAPTQPQVVCPKAAGCMVAQQPMVQPAQPIMQPAAQPIAQPMVQPVVQVSGGQPTTVTMGGVQPMAKPMQAPTMASMYPRATSEPKKQNKVAQAVSPLSVDEVVANSALTRKESKQVAQALAARQVMQQPAASTLSGPMPGAPVSMPGGMPGMMPMPMPMPMPVPMPMPTPGVKPEEKKAEEAQATESKPEGNKQETLAENKPEEVVTMTIAQAKRERKREEKQAKKEAKALRKGKKGVASADAYAEKFERPAPSPSPRARREEGIVESEEGLNPKKVFQIRCPQCGKLLNVRETSPYHRCPACSKVFSLRKFEKYTLKK